MRQESELIERNAAFLAQAKALLAALSDEVYGARPRGFERGGIGAHVRHVLDHFDAFLDGVETGRIDYDARARDLATEHDLGVARARLGRTIARLEAFCPREEARARPLTIAMDAGGRGGEIARVATAGESSLGRELQFLLSHTVHHFALIAVALRLSGIEPAPDFGVAPSTLRFESRAGGACAR